MNSVTSSDYTLVTVYIPTYYITHRPSFCSKAYSHLKRYFLNQLFEVVFNHLSNGPKRT